uniref:Zinc finger protein 831 n=1 Tax=Cavia porcellus TaxID=10141 RepID=H0V3U2_CAVPO
MEAPEPTCPAPAARDQTVPTPGPLGAPSGQASPRLTLGPIILPSEQGLPPTMILKALPIPLYHTVPPGGLQPRAPLVTGSLDGGSVPFILSPLLQPEGPGPTQVGKPATPALTVNIVGTLPVLSPGLGPTLGSPGKVRNAGRYLCPHCGRDCLKPSVLEKHIRSHTGERPFPCVTCGIAFKTQSNLYKHRRTQTHLNNSRLSLESEAGGSSVLEDGDRAEEPSAAESRAGDAAPGRPLSPGAHLSLGVKNPDVKAESAPRLGSTPAHREAPTDSSQMVSPGLPLASMQPWRKLLEPKPCSLQRQQEVSGEKPWDAKASEGRLRKCESTDSGYLSRSDSVEQPPLPSSPLHSLSEHSAESEGEGGPGPGPGHSRAEPPASGASLELEKKRLEERIARLISHNQAVVDDPQLDHVRPRKTVLSKQGSIDLPMPYTYKDSFHFDIRALEPGRRRAALGPASSTFSAPDKSRPLFFHSVPTQLSATVEYVPVTRSNSLPFVEASSTWPEPRDLQDTCPRMQQPLSPRLAPVRLSDHSRLTLVDIPSGHPRALVRQAAVEDMPCTSTGEPMAPAEDLGGKTVASGEGVPCRARVARRKCGQRKPKMFSQEKWQVYGHETFKRIYQKTKASHQGVQKARDGQAVHGTELDPPPQKEAAGSRGAAPSHDSGTAMLGDVSIEAKPGSRGSLPAPEGSLETESPTQGRTVLRMARAGSSPTLGSRDSPGSGNRSPLVPPTGQPEPRWQPPSVPGFLHEGDLGAPGPAVSDLQPEGGTCPRAPAILRRPGGGSGESWPAEDKLPSERKKLKVEGMSPQKQLGPLGADTPGGSAQCAFVTSQRRDSDPGETAGLPRENAERVADHLASSGTFSAAPGQHSQLATQPQAPGAFSPTADSSFLPKYLLRLPQGAVPSLLSVPLVSTQGQHSLCTAGPPKTPWSPSPAPDPVPSEVHSSLEEPSCSRARDGKNERPAGREKQGEESGAQVPASRVSPGSATGAPQGTDSLIVQGSGGQTYATCHPCTGSTSRTAITSGGALKSQACIGELQGPPENAPEDHPSKLNPYGSIQPVSFLKALTRPQPLSSSQSELSLSPDLGTPRSCGAQSRFPSLKAEPQLTWCCLRRSLPLPQEQKEKAASVYSALHFPGGRLRDGGPDTRTLHSGGHTSVGPGGAGGGGAEGEGRPAQTSQVTPALMRSQDRTLDPEQKKGLPRRRARMTRGNGRQKKLRISPKRCEGNFWQSRVHRLRKPPWGPRRSCPPPPLGPRSPEVAGLSLQGAPACVTSPLSPVCGDAEKEDARRPTSEMVSSVTGSRASRETDKLASKEISPSVGEPNDCSTQEDIVTLLESSLQSDARLAVPEEDSLPPGQGLAVGLLETQQLPSQDQVSKDPMSCTFSDAQEPPPGPKEPSACHAVDTPPAAICISLGVRASHTRPGVHSLEPRSLAQSSPHRRLIEESTSQTLLPEKPSSGQTVSGLAPSVSSYQEEGKAFPARGQYGCGDTAVPSPAAGNHSEESHMSGFITAKGCVVPSKPGKPSEVPEAPLKSIRKRSLEGMRKQTRVELSDTSSDDEDRLVIEI